jgi:hypothetical protein
VRLERFSLGIAATYVVMIPWVWLLRMDTGVVFCSAEDFRTIGGYDERRYFGEDVQLFFDLRRVGRGRRQKLTRVRSAKALSSMRKWDLYGDWHYFTMILRLLGPMIFNPRAADEEALRYWYGQDHD